MNGEVLQYKLELIQTNSKKLEKTLKSDGYVLADLPELQNLSDTVTGLLAELDQLSLDELDVDEF